MDLFVSWFPHNKQWGGWRVSCGHHAEGFRLAAESSIVLWSLCVILSKFLPLPNPLFPLLYNVGFRRALHFQTHHLGSWVLLQTP